ncbi:helix-turn-helix transcriptional regulator [Tropicimonas marinistellae]|uniref:helix-turn-helix transcriptional regulator n=1 Tax=Tropicimonas marinistellae TaxID=1739787 RepID=UPI00098EC2BE
MEGNTTWDGLGRIFRRTAIEEITGLSRSTIYAMMARDEFPRPVRIGRRAVGWREIDMRTWLESRKVEHS